MKNELANLIFLSIRESRSIEELAERLVERGVQIVPEGAKMSRDKQMNEMRYLADEMGKAISTEYEKRVLADERKLEEVLKANGWRKVPEGAMVLTRAELDALNNYEKCRMQNAECRVASEVAREVFAEIEENAIEHDLFGRTVLFIGQGTLAELKKKYTVTDTNDGCKESEDTE